MENNNNRIKNRLKKARDLRFRGKFQKAIKFLQKLVVSNQNEWSIWNEFATTHNKFGEYSEAVKYATKALKIEHHHEGFDNLFYAYDKLKEFDKAMRVIKEYTSMYHLELEEKLDFKEDGLPTLPVMSESQINFIAPMLKRVFKNPNNINMEDLKDKLSNTHIHPFKVRSHFKTRNLINYLFHHGFSNTNIYKSDKILELLNLIMTILPSNELALNAMANTFDKSDNTEKAREYYEKSLNLNPTNLKTLESYTNFTIKNKDYDKALELCNQAINYLASDTFTNQIGS